MSAVSEAHTLRLILEHAPGFIVLCDLDANILYVNRTEHGYKMEDTIGKSYYDFLAPTQAELIRNAHRVVRETGEEQVIDYFLDTPDDGRIHMLTRIAAYRPRGGEEVRGYVNIVADVTDEKVAEERVAVLERQRAQHALARELSRTERILETMMDGYLLLAEDATIIDCNDASCRMHGCTRDELIGRAFGDLVEDDLSANAHDIMQRVRTTGAQRYESVHMSNGGSVDVEVSAAPLPRDSETLVVAFVRDISEAKQAARENAELAAQLQQQQRLDSIGTLASGVAHEINNPLQGIISFAELIVRRAQDEENKMFASEIVAECKRVAEIVNNLLAFARSETDTRSIATLSEIVASTMSLLSGLLMRDNITLEADVPDDLPGFECRGQQMRQVVMNLLTNARDALNERYPDPNEGKRIKIVAETFERGADTWLRLSVTDFGNGVAPENIPRVFDPFFSTKKARRGTGLGLSVSHGIVTEHGGFLRLESELGAYTTFSLELPAFNEAARKGHAEAQ
jgi:PAS domain S-box-containing protein